MTTSTPTLTDRLTTAVAPHLGLDPTASRRTLKGVAKSLRRLAKGLTNKRVKQEQAAAKAAQKAAAPTTKMKRKALTSELVTALHPHLGLEDAGANVPKKFTKTVKHLAAQLVQQHRKQARQAAKAADKAASKTAGKAHPKSSNAKVVVPASKAARRAPRMKPAATKQPDAKVAVVAKATRATAPVLDGVGR